jgi:outer membrane protein assembly factor BamB
MTPHRSHIARILFAAIVFSGCQSIRFDLPGRLTAEDWPTDGKTADRSRYVPETLSLPLEVSWEYSANAGFGPGSPLILDGVVLVGTRKGEIHAVELETGRKRGFKKMGEAIEGSPLIANGMLYVPSAWGKKVLVGFDLKRGVISWKVAGVPFETALVAHEDNVVGVDVEGTVRSFNGKTGEEVWRLELGEKISAQASPLLISPNQLFVATDDGNGYLVDLNVPDIIWQTNLGAPVYVSPVTSDGVIYISTTRGSLVAIEAVTGEQKWLMQTLNPEVRMGAPAVDGERVYLGATDGRVRSVDINTGEVQWEVQLSDVVTGAPLVTRETVFVGTMGRDLMGLRVTTGDLVWEVEMKGRIKSAMAIAGEGLIVLSEPRYVTYFKHVEQSDEG